MNVMKATECTRTRLFAAALALGLVFAMPVHAAGPHVRCLRTGSGEVAGELVSVSAGSLLLLRAEDETTRLSVAQLREIAFAGERTRVPAPAFTVWTVDRTELRVQSIRRGPRADSLELRGHGWQALSVPLTAVRAVAPTPPQPTGASTEASEELRSLLAEPPVGSDRLRLRRDDGDVVLNCTVSAMDAAGLSVVLAGSPVEFGWDETDWVVLGLIGAGRRPEEQQHRVTLVDGSTLPAADFGTRGDDLVLDAGAYTVEAGLWHFRRISVASAAYRYLTAEDVTDVEVRPILDVVWRPRFGRNALGSAIALEGRTYTTGIGMHPRTKMTFLLDGSWTRFHARIGIDDAAGDLGNVVYRVMVDGREAYASGSVVGSDPPRAIEVDIAGGRRLSLVVEPGGPDPVGNLADWAEARVVR